MHMTAAVLASPGGHFEVGDVELAAPREGEVLVRIAASGLCGSDLNVLDGRRSLSPFPVVLGHEAAGTIAEVGPGVNRLRPGDPVVLSILPSCGRCPACKRGVPNYCATASAAMAAGNLMDGSSRLSRGGDRVNHFLTVSSFAQYAVVPQSGAVAIPPGLPLDRIVLISYLGSSVLGRDVSVLVDLYLAGELMLDDIISHRIGLDDLEEAFDRLRAGDGARNVIELDH